MTKEEVEILERLLRLQEYKLVVWKDALNKNIKGELSEENLTKAREDYYRTADNFKKIYVVLTKKDVKYATKK